MRVCTQHTALYESSSGSTLDLFQVESNSWREGAINNIMGLKAEFHVHATEIACEQKVLYPEAS